MLIGMGLGQLYWEFFTANRSDVSLEYIVSLQAIHVAYGGKIGFFSGMILRFLYTTIAAFGRHVDDVEEIKEKIKKNNSKS